MIAFSMVCGMSLSFYCFVLCGMNRESRSFNLLFQKMQKEQKYEDVMLCRLFLMSISIGL